MMTPVRDVESELRFYEQRYALGIQHSKLLNAEEAAEFQAWRRERREDRVVSYDAEAYRSPPFYPRWSVKKRRTTYRVSYFR